MALIVRFPDHIEAVTVAQLGEEGGVGIVAGADGVDVCFLHQAQVFFHHSRGHGIAYEGVGIVAVNAPELDRFAVQEDDVPVPFDLPETHRLIDGLAAAGERQGVKGGVFRIPEVGGGDVDGKGAVPDGAGGDSLAVGGGQGIGNRSAFLIKSKGNFDFCFGIVVGKGRPDGEVPDVIFRPAEQVNVPENAGHPELVLILKVAAIAPFQHQDSHGVDAFL